MDVSKSLVTKPKARVAIFWLGFYGFLFIVGLTSFYRLFLQQGPDLFLLGYITFLAFAAFEVRKYTVLLLNPRKHSLHIGPEGLYFRKTSSRLLPWSEVGTVSTVTRLGRTLVKILPPEHSPAEGDKPGIANRLRKLAKETYARSYLIDASRLSLPADELVEIIQTYAMAYNSPAARD